MSTNRADSLETGDQLPRVAMWAGGLTLALIVLSLVSWWLLEYWFLALWLVWASLIAGGALVYNQRLRDPEENPNGRHLPRVPVLAVFWICFLGGTVGALLASFGRQRDSRVAKYRFQLGLVLGAQAAFVVFYVILRFVQDQPPPT